MNFELSFIPERSVKPRDGGLNMMMDKGLSIRQVEDFIEQNAELTDFVKLGFGTSYMSQNVKEKIALYHSADIKVYLGGTLFEAFYVRGMLKEYRQLIDKWNLNTLEISDGSITLDHDKKCELIKEFAKDYTVLSEVGSKEEGILISPGKWISMMRKELDAGSWKVIAEARESGNVGIYRPNGSAHTMLVNRILKQVRSEDIIWEAPKKPQQVWFIKLLGPNVNLGNVAENEIIPLETLRLGLRGDTFFDNLPENISESFKVRV